MEVLKKQIFSEIFVFINLVNKRYIFQEIIRVMIRKHSNTPELLTRPS